jgi:hypothetical protein
MSQLYISNELKYIKTAGLAKKLIEDSKEIIKELNSIIKTVESKS